MERTLSSRTRRRRGVVRLPNGAEWRRAGVSGCKDLRSSFLPLPSQGPLAPELCHDHDSDHDHRRHDYQKKVFCFEQRSSPLSCPPAPKSGQSNPSLNQISCSQARDWLSWHSSLSRLAHESMHWLHCGSFAGIRRQAELHRVDSQGLAECEWKHRPVSYSMVCHAIQARGTHESSEWH
jgi:hypothetical protein